jgi:hypothetical protein
VAGWRGFARVSGRCAGQLLGVHCCEEGADRVGYCSGRPPGQMMAGSVDQLKASVWQGSGQTATGRDGDQGVLRVG